MSKTLVFTDENTPSVRVSTQTRPHMYVQNVPVCTGTTRTCFNTCARCAGIHGDVLNVHMGTCLSGHTGFFSVSHHTTTPHTPHRPHRPHTTPRHKTQHHTETDRDRQRQRQREKRGRKRRRQDKSREKREE